MKSIAIIGAGISGLTSGYLLHKKQHKVSIFEKSFRYGGCVGSQNKEGFLIEIGTNSFLDNEPKAQELIQTLGLSSEIIESQEHAKVRYLYFNKKLHRAPANPKEILSSSIISPMAKFRILLEMLLPPRPYTDQDTPTIFEVFKKHFGEEISENLVRTGLVGVYGGDSKKLLARETLPKIMNVLKNNKSLLKGLKAQKSNQKPKLLSFKGGLQTLVDKLYAEVREQVQLSSEVTAVHLKGSQIELTYENDSGESSNEKFDEVIFTTPFENVVSLLSPHIPPPDIANLQLYETAPIRTISMGFSSRISLEGFGVLVSPKENMNILGFLHPTDIFEGRSPKGKSLVTVMMGGAFKPELLSTSTQNSTTLALKDLETILGPLPSLEDTWIWNHTPGISQYTQESISAFQKLQENVQKLSPNFHFNMQAYEGVSLNDCIRKSYELANRIS